MGGDIRTSILNRGELVSEYIRVWLSFQEDTPTDPAKMDLVGELIGRRALAHWVNAYPSIRQKHNLTEQEMAFLALTALVQAKKVPEPMAASIVEVLKRHPNVSDSLTAKGIIRYAEPEGRG